MVAGSIFPDPVTVALWSQRLETFPGFPRPPPWTGRPRDPRITAHLRYAHKSFTGPGADDTAGLRSVLWIQTAPTAWGLIGRILPVPIPSGAPHKMCLCEE